MVRVCRPGGTVAVIDMVHEPGPTGTRHDELERLRDPSHHGALTEDELLAALGARASVLGERHQRMPLESWLAQAKVAEPAARTRIVDAIQAEADGGAPTGLHGAADADNGLSIEQRWVIVGRPVS